MQRIYLLLGIILTVCSTEITTAQNKSGRTAEPRYVWKKLLDNADWKKSYNFQMLTLRDTLWVFHTDGNWYSVDGSHWTKSKLSNSIFNLAFLDYIQFNNAIYGLGHFEGNIERFTLRNDVYRTTNLKQWATITNSNLPKRFFYHPFVFNNKLWIIGGEDKDRKYSDIWNSADAIRWTKLKENLPFGYSDGAQFVFFNKKIIMLSNDVWSSADGLNWQQETSAIVPGVEVFGYAPIVYGNKIWLLGCNRNGQFTSQVLVSADGKSWIGMDAPWTPRGGIAASVYKDKIFMTGGKYGGTPNQPDFRYSNDVWVLEKKD